MTQEARETPVRPWGESPLIKWLALSLIVVAVVAAYWNSFNGEFVFDDLQSIPDNPSIRTLWPPSKALNPPNGTGATVEGRPILNYSFAINYSLGGTDVRGYHVGNLAIHVLAALVLFGIIRRTVVQMGSIPGRDVDYLAAVGALMWGLHPLQTESVAYIAQRAESLMGLLFMISLYGAVRSFDSRKSRIWPAMSVVAAWLCAGTKEVAVVLPIVVVFYDRTFVSGTFSNAVRKGRGLYLGLVSSWILLIFLILRTGDRGGTIGGRSGITHWDYALCQCRALFHYLRLSIWPTPLVMDYGPDIVSLREALPWAIALLAALSLVALAVAKRPALGFLGVWFLVILAPTSSFVGGTRQMLAEHRVYLSLAAVAVGVAVLAYRYLGRPGLVMCLGSAVALGVTTFSRNGVYRDGLSLYRDTVLHRPNNPWARNNYGLYLERDKNPRRRSPNIGRPSA